jgi:hypothetical protein
MQHGRWMRVIGVVDDVKQGAQLMSLEMSTVQERLNFEIYVRQVQGGDAERVDRLATKRLVH